MSRTAVEQLLRLMDGAFAGVGEPPDDPHSLLANLRSVGEEARVAVSPRVQNPPRYGEAPRPPPGQGKGMSLDNTGLR